MMIYEVDIEQFTISALFDLKGAAKELSARIGGSFSEIPEQPNTRVISGSRCICCLGPKNWIVWDSAKQPDALSAELKSDTASPAISIVDISDSLTFFRINGPDANQIMSIACPLDIHFDAFKENSASYSEFFGTKALITRTESGFEIAVDQSNSVMIIDHLNRTSHNVI
jgi:heterotetrameric sarcosine oxidase gamma subunit